MVKNCLICGDLNGTWGLELRVNCEVCMVGLVNNVQGERLLEFADALKLAVASAWFKQTHGSRI